MNARAYIRECYGDKIATQIMEGPEYDPAILGIIQRCGEDPIIIYAEEKLIEINMADGMTYDEAVDHLEYNQKGGWMGPGTWGVLTPIPEEF